MSRLKELRINQEGLLPSFETDIHDYYLIIDNSISNLEIEAIPENLNSKVEILGNTDFKEGENTVIIKVINGQEETYYNIHVTKTNNINSSNSNLEILAIEGEMLEPEFDANITQYNLEVSNEITRLNILAIPENENADVEINGTEKINIGNNIIEILVTSKDNSIQKLYEINVYRRTMAENKEYNETREENYEKVQELLNQSQTEEGYNVERSNVIVTQYKSNNEVIKIGILLSILFVLIIVLILKKQRNK